MLSQETVSHDAEDADPRLIAFARRPFKWRVEETIEIPVGLVAAHLNAEHGVHSFMELLRLLGFEGRFHGFMSWFTLPAPHRHIHVDILFGHRPLARKVMTYNEAESASCFVFIAYRLFNCLNRDSKTRSQRHYAATPHQARKE